MTDVYSMIVRFLQEGGVFIYPISLVFVIGLAIGLERWIYLQVEKSRNSKAFRDFLPMLKNSDIRKLQGYTRENSAPVVRVIGAGLDMMDVSRQRADVENAMSEGMLETMPRLEQRTNYLGLLANVSTLLGLLGTIIGLIGAFTAVANADPAEKSQLLSSSISVAMNTTAFGLISAIPLLILNGILQNKTKSIITSIEMSAVKFLNIMTLQRHIEAGAPRQESGFSSDEYAQENQSFNGGKKLKKAIKKEAKQEPLATRLQQQAETAPVAQSTPAPAIPQAASAIPAAAAAPQEPAQNVAQPAPATNAVYADQHASENAFEQQNLQSAASSFSQAPIAPESNTQQPAQSEFAPQAGTESNFAQPAAASSPEYMSSEQFIRASSAPLSADMASSYRSPTEYVPTGSQSASEAGSPEAEQQQGVSSESDTKLSNSNYASGSN